MMNFQAASRGGAVRFFGLGLALLLGGTIATLLLPGCSNPVADGYDANMRYPLRLDPIVLQAPAIQPTRPPAAGKMDEFLAQLPTIGGVTLDPKQLPQAQQEQLTAALDAEFGTPAEPHVNSASAEQSTTLALDAETLKLGSASYRVRCADCHGLPGHGRGPSGPWNYPYARDFRSGLFKYATGSANNGKPSLPDLTRVIRRGVTGTPMPIFDLLEDADVRALAGYTMHLSIRGEVELRMLKALLSGDEEGIAENLSEAARDFTKRIVNQWMLAQSPSDTALSLPLNANDAESIRRGHALFANALGGSGCIACHVAYGKTESYRYDIWGLPARVGNLTESNYKWGREPEDLAKRIRLGIHPVNMPANPTLTAEQVRDLTNFLHELPYPARLPDDVRRTVDAAR